MCPVFGQARVSAVATAWGCRRSRSLGTIQQQCSRVNIARDQQGLAYPASKAMFARHSTSALSAAERRLVQSQWARSGQCYRCFHASHGRRADEDAKDGKGASSTSSNAPQRGQTRQQRAAMVSQEVKAIAQDSPSSRGFNRGTDARLTRQKAQESNLGAAEQSKAPDRMGDNASPGQEGPLAQGVGREIRSDDEVADTSSQVRGVRTPNSRTEEPAEGGASVLEPTIDISIGQPSTNTTDEPSKAVERTKEPKKADLELDTRMRLLELGQNGSTVLAGNFVGVIADRMNLLSQPGTHNIRRTTTSLRQKLRHRRLVRFRNLAEKKETGYSSFKSIRSEASQSLVDKMVLGVYDVDGLLQGKEKHKQPVLNDIARMTLKNPTYLSKDGERLLKKVQSLLPATQGARPARK